VPERLTPGEVPEVDRAQSVLQRGGEKRTHQRSRVVMKEPRCPGTQSSISVHQNAALQLDRPL
jgi:hypothetical protein